MDHHRRTLLKTFLYGSTVLAGCGGGGSDEISDDLFSGNNESTIEITSAIHIKSPASIRDRHLVIRPPHGQLIIDGSTLSIHNSKIDIYFPTGSNLSPNSAFKLLSGEFNSFDTIYNAYAATPIVDGGYYDDPSPNLIIDGLGKGTAPHLSRAIKLVSNEFVCYPRQFIGALSLRGGQNSASILNDSGACILNAKNNYFTGFNGVIITSELTGADIAYNRVEKNTFVQFRLEGKNINFQNNTILSPGDGTPGDGLNLMGRITNCTVANNDIINGSCYGIAINSSNIDGLSINNNFISSGITHALLFEHDSTLAQWKNINVFSNIFTDNVGGVALTGVDCSGISIIKNYFQDNLLGWPSPVISYNESINNFTNNLVFDDLPEKLNRDNLSQLSSLGDECPAIFVTGIRD